MRKVVAAEFVTLDGVIGDPDQWHFPYFNEEMGADQGTVMAYTGTMLLGRRTYEEFAAVWPGRTSQDFGPFADFMNKTPKVVVSKTLKTVDWENSTMLGGDLADGVTKLKNEPGNAIVVLGSATLVKSLLHENLLDEIHLLMDPILVGRGRRLFESEYVTVPLELVSSNIFKTGVLSLTYVPAVTGGDDTHNRSRRLR